jgi:hypothetical protein
MGKRAPDMQPVGSRAVMKRICVKIWTVYGFLSPLLKLEKSKILFTKVTLLCSK